ncbi:pyridoxamine 5'-phosphate oxidase family protein [Pokkaliibacter sp. CJK22405]|uniref:pyridoxamine 5'-phosphate oxidase family protein n=1 Tax=Pokkaliibacter sp. CJK22405 TaxID=3384615 RepID=UPI0039848C34
MSERTRVRRGAKRAVDDREQLEAIIDECLICHVAGQTGDCTTVLPTAHWRMGEYVYIHGHSRNGLMRQLMNGQTCCLSFTLLDGLVMAKSAFNHSMNYRSAVLFGVMEEVTGDHKEESLIAFIDHISPGRSTQARMANEIELKATMVLRIKIEEWSCKVRNAPTGDDAEDQNLPVWSGVIPLQLSAREPVADRPDGEAPSLPRFWRTEHPYPSSV